MSVRTQNWMKFGGLVILAFTLGLLFAGLLDLPTRSSAQQTTGSNPAITRVQAPDIPAARPLVELSDAFAAVAERVRPSVVYVSSQRRERSNQRVPEGFEQFFPRQRPQILRGTGSGFIVSNDGYIITNHHVVEGATSVTVRLLDRREFTAKVIGSDENTDIAVIKIDARGLSPVAFGNSDGARIGEWVLAIGNPLGEQLSFTVTSGIVSAKGRALSLGNQPGGIQDFIQTDAAINPGNSGGPLVNVRGEVIGINSAIASETGYYSGYGFAIPINLAQVVMNQLIADGRVHRAALGITVQTASKEDAEYAGLSEIGGVRIENFSRSSPAERSGLEVGDIIVKVDGKPLQYVAQLQQAVGFRRPGETVEVEVARRGGVRKTYKVRLVAMDETLASAEGGDENATPGPESPSENMGLLGASVAPVNSQFRESYEIPSNVSGLVITTVDPAGPAAETLNSAEDRGGPDVIVAVEGKPVRTEAELQAALRAIGPGRIVTLRVYSVAGAQFGIKRLRLGEK
jgi:serine protease Do